MSFQKVEDPCSIKFLRKGRKINVESRIESSLLPKIHLTCGISVRQVYGTWVVQSWGCGGEVAGGWLVPVASLIVASCFLCWHLASHRFQCSSSHPLLTPVFLPSVSYTRFSFPPDLCKSLGYSFPLPPHLHQSNIHTSFRSHAVTFTSGKLSWPAGLGHCSWVTQRSYAPL